MNVYAPNDNQMNFIRQTLHKAQAVKQGYLLICGDFNLVADVHMDTTLAAKRRESPLKRFLHSQDLYDVWRCHHGSERTIPTFPHIISRIQE